MRAIFSLRIPILLVSSAFLSQDISAQLDVPTDCGIIQSCSFEYDVCPSYYNYYAPAPANNSDWDAFYSDCDFIERYPFLAGRKIRIPINVWIAGNSHYGVVNLSNVSQKISAANSIFSDSNIELFINIKDNVNNISVNEFEDNNGNTFVGTYYSYEYPLDDDATPIGNGTLNCPSTNASAVGDFFSSVHQDQINYLIVDEIRHYTTSEIFNTLESSCPSSPSFPSTPANCVSNNYVTFAVGGESVLPIDNSSKRGLLIAKQKQFDPETIAHEIGHFLGLDHTFATPLNPNFTVNDDMIFDNYPDGSSCDDPLHNNLMDYNNSIINDDITTCQSAKMIDVLFDCRSVLQWNLSAPKISISDGNTNSLALSSHSITLECSEPNELSFVVVPNNNSVFNTGAIKWILLDVSGGQSQTLQEFDYSESIELADISPFINFSIEGNFQIVGYEEIPWNGVQSPLASIDISIDGASCPDDCSLQTISFNPTLSTALCAGSDRFSINYVVPNNASLPVYLFDDGINPPVTVSRGQSFYETYPSGTMVNLTMSDPNNPDCAVVSTIVTADCENEPVDPCAGALITSVGQADCAAGTVPVTISGDPGTEYILQEILNENDNNASSVTILGGNITDVPFNADGSGLLSFSLRYAGQPAGEECDRETSVPLVCEPTGPGGGMPNGCNTEADPTTYSLYWPYPENSMFLDTDCGRGLTFGCGIAGSCGTQGYSMTVSDGCGAHWGNDFYAQDWSQGSSAAVCDDNFYAPMDGTVIYTYDACAASCGASPNCNPNSTPYGNEVVILSSDGNYALRVGHLNSVTVTNNTPIFAGQLIGTIGNTGNSFGAHIHAALYQNVNDASGGSTFVQRLQNGELFGVSNGSAATANAQDFEFDCANSIEVLSASAPGECVDPGSPFAIEFSERGTLQQVFVEFCPTDGGTCQLAAGGGPFVLNNLVATDTWTLNTTAPSAPGDYTVKIYDQNNTVVQASSAFPFQVTTNCSTVSMDCLPPQSVTPQANATGNEVTISWPGVAGVISYRVEVKTTDSNNWTLVSTTTGTTAGFISRPCTGYDVRVASNCDDGSRTGYAVSGVVTAGCTGPGGTGGGTTGNSGAEFVGDCPGDNDDDEDPVFINCPPNQTYIFGIDNADACEAYVNWSVPVAVDNCNVTITYDGEIEPGTLQPVGNYSVTYIAEDNNNNDAICNFTVIVEDPQTLTFSNCPTETLVFGNDTDQCSVTANWSIPVAVDNCEVTVTQVAGPAPGETLAPGVYNVVYQAVNNGTPQETATCSFFVQVNETQNPELNCPQDVFVSSDPGVCEAAVDNLQLEFAFDNCPYTVTWASSPTDVTGTGTSTSDNASGAIFPVGVTTVTYTIMENDDNGNGIAVASCDIIVEVTDTEAPEVTCPPSVVIGTDNDAAGNYDCATDYTWNHPTPTDNCAVTAYTITYTNPDGSTEGSTDLLGQEGSAITRNFALGVTTILYHVEDAEGNITECSWTVEVIDDEDPMIFCEQVVATDVFTYGGQLDLWPEDVVTAILPVAVDMDITDINILSLAGTQADMGDLTITLTSPAGTTITLFDGLCVGTADFNLGLDDASATAVNAAACGALLNGDSFAPASALSVFNGERSQGNWVLTITNASAGMCGYLTNWALEIIGNDVTPAGNRLQVIANEGTCTYTMRGADFNPPFTDNCPGAFITHDYTFGPFDNTLEGSVFELGETTVVWTVTDAAGNAVSCTLIVEVLDTEAPQFTNCPRPDIILNPLPGTCEAFTNFSLPLATDNCTGLTVTQTDATGLTTGTVFPVGTTILTWEATDAAGNRDSCELRIIVNDNHPVVGAGCPDDVAVNTDPGDCGAVINGIAPDYSDSNCPDNLSIVYRIDEVGGEEWASGFFDASGTFFNLGNHTVQYRAQDQPLLLITEITHHIQATLGGNDVIPAYISARGLPDGDFLELTNFGPASLDLGGLDIERIHAGGRDTFRVPALEILAPGEVFVLHFGHDYDSPADHYYNVHCAMDLAATDGAAYIISHSGRVLDVAAINGFNPVGAGVAGVPALADWSGSVSDENAGIRRRSVWDDNAAEDFIPAFVCGEITIGMLNPDLSVAAANGRLTALQAQRPNKQECSFEVVVADNELPVCGSYEPYDNFNYNTATVIEAGDCFEATVDVPNDYLLADVNTFLQASAGDLANLTVKLISPEGTELILSDGICVGSNGWEITYDSDSLSAPFVQDACALLADGRILRPSEDLNLFHKRPAQGTWTLQIAHNATVDAAAVSFTAWELSLSELIPYQQTDTIIENDFRLCGADFTWLHTGIWDNCPGGELSVSYTFQDGTVQDMYPISRQDYGLPITRFFDVGLTTVTYSMTDVNGNTAECDFVLTVLDTEPPQLECPSDTTLFLAGGECDIIYIPTNWWTEDNCGVVDTITDPEWHRPLPIGVNPVTLTVVDSSGNETACVYVVTVVEYMPNPPQMACIGDINISLTNTCEQTIIPSMVLAGTEYYCFDNYIVSLLQEDEDGVPVLLPSTTVGLDQVGDRIIYQVYDPRNDILCWGYVNVGFYEAPDFICPADTTIHCNASTDTAFMGSPVLLSCALVDATVTFADTLQRFEACDDPRAILRRTWTVADNFGNASSCVQTITISAFDLDVIVFPPDYDGVNNPALNCVDVANNASLTEPIFTGFPTVLGGSNIFQDNFCSAAYLYTDEVYNICAGSYEILRTWKVRNTCMPVIPGINPREAIQLIRVLDAENPQLSCPENVTISTGPFDCEGVYLIPPPVVEANCSNYTYEVSVSGGTLNRLADGSYTLANLEQGTYSIRYEVEDECGRYSECIYFVTVVDEVDATAVCEDGLNVSLDGNGQAILLAADVDGGSDDLCGSVDLAIRRLVINEPNNCSLLGTSFFTDWGPSIALSCCDLDSLVTVELRVIDEQGNQSVCWTNILVEDKLAPVCLPPPPVFINCLDLADNFPNDVSAAFDADSAATIALLNQLFGQALAGDNCGSATISQSVVDARTSCGIGLIQRRFRATDQQGLISPPNCMQNITVRAVHDYTIVLPADRSSDLCAIPSYEDLVIEDNGCGLFNISTSLDTFFATADECYKLQITYEIINWCEYNGEEDPYIIPRDADENNNLEEETFLHILPRSFNTIEDDVAVLSRTQDRSGTNLIALLDRDDVGQDGFAGLGGLVDGASLTNGYGLDGSRGHFRYRQFIKVYDNAAPVIIAEDPSEPICDEDGDCVADVSLTFSVTDGCSQSAVQLTISLDRFREDRNSDGVFTLADFAADGGLIQSGISRDSAGNYSLVLPGLPFGEHAIRISANDGCGNTSVDLLLFEVVDCKAPTPICINGLTVTLMPDGSGDGMAAIWASDYIASEVTDCSGEVRYAIYTDEMATAADFAGPNLVDTGLVFTCADAGLQIVRIYAIDPAGRADYCETTLDVQRFSPNLCDGSAGGFLAGFIHTPSANPMANVSLSLAGGNAGAMSSMTSNDTDETGAYHFENLPYDLDYTVAPAHNPAVNLSRVTTADLILISRHILGLQPLTSNYQLLAADVTQDQFINVVDIINIRRVILGLATAYTASPSWRFYTAAGTEVYNANNLQNGILDANFTAMEMGNVSDAVANAQQGTSRGEAEIRLDDQQLLAGETYTILFESAHLAGYQATLALAEGLELLDIDFSPDQTTGFNLEQAANGLLAVSHIGDSSFALRVRAARNARLSELLQLSDRITPSEAYTLDGSTANLRLSFRSLLDQGQAFSLEQNLPNPFSATTKIDFYLPSNSPATLSVQDLQGRNILVRSLEGSAGHNSLILTSEELKGAAGVLFYSIVAGQHTATRKMIVVR